MKFYSVKDRKMVTVPDKDCTKCKKARATGGYIYMVRAKDKTGSNLVLFVSEATWKALKVKEIKK